MGYSRSIWPVQLGGPFHLCNWIGLSAPSVRLSDQRRVRCTLPRQRLCAKYYHSHSGAVKGQPAQAERPFALCQSNVRYNSASMETDSVYRLLALCARVECSEELFRSIQTAANALPDWSTVPARAEAHRVAPLLYAHLKAAHVEPPLPVWRELQGLYLRHRRATEIRTAALCEILAAFNAAAIPVAVLKGAALAHFLYPEPGLRPHSDLDLLVPPSELLRAQQEVQRLGFQGPPPPRQVTHRHLPPLRRWQDGVDVEVELHHRLLSNYFDNVRAYARSAIGLRDPIGAKDNRLQDLTVSPQTFQINDHSAETLGLEDQLRHLCDHLISHVNVWDYARLIWVVDIVSLTERFVREIDWDRVRRQSPQVINTLAVLHWMTPLSTEIRHAAGIETGSRPAGIGVEFDGWPRVRTPRNRSLLRRTLWPSEWWLRLRYARGTRSIWRERWIRHPLHIMGQVGRAILEKLGWPTARELATRSRSSQEQT